MPRKTGSKSKSASKKSKSKSASKSKSGTRRASRSASVSRSGSRTISRGDQRIAVFTNGQKGRNGNHFTTGGESRGVLIEKLNQRFGPRGWLFTATPRVDAAFLVRPNGTTSEGGTKAAKAPLAIPRTISEFLAYDLGDPSLIIKWNIAQNDLK